MIRELIRPDWWVIEWASECGSLSGQFALVGGSRQSAIERAQDDVRQNPWVTDGTYHVRVRRPKVVERLAPAWRARPRARLLVAWYDLWVGAYWDRRSRTLYLLPWPCVGIAIQFSHAHTSG